MTTDPLSHGNKPNVILIGAEVLAVVVVAFGVLSAVISPTPHIDEMYHMLAARSYNHSGSLVIQDGGEPYIRARAFTYAVAACQRWFGETWASARLPSLVSGSLLVAAVFVWLLRVAGHSAAWLGAALMLLAPDLIAGSSMVRFYIPHALFIWLGWICLYEAVAGAWGVRARSAWVIVAVVLALCALHLQETTAIAGVSALLWLIFEGAGWLMRCSASLRRRYLMLAAVVLLIVVPIGWLALEASGMLAHMIDKLQTPRLWSLPHRNDIAYYHHYLSDAYPMLWGLFFLIAVSAVIHRRKAAWFCVVLFLTTFTVHSLLAFKAKRYLLYALPCLFSLWALGGAGVLSWLRESSRSILPDDWPSEGVLRRVLDRLLPVVLLVGVLFALWVAPGPKLGREMLIGRTLGPLARENWSEASAVLKTLAERTGFVASSSPPKALYYLGRHDLGLSVSQAAGREEFAVDRIMGRPVITRSDSLKRVMIEHPSGLIVIESAHWRVPRFVPDEVARFILDHAQPIDLPDSTGVMAFTWGLNDTDELSGGMEEQQEP